MTNISKKIWELIKENKFYICLAVIFIIALSLRLYAIHNKTTLTFDDPSSYVVITQNNYFRNYTFKYNWSDLRFEYSRNYTAYEMKKALFECRSDLKSIWEDLVSLHFFTIDRQHPNLYYSILRIWSSGVDFSSQKDIILRGCYLNLIFFPLTFFFLYKLLNLINPDRSFVALGLFFAFVTTGGISNTMLIRPYPMMECFFILIIYLFVNMYNSIDKDFDFSIKRILFGSFCFALMLLSHYYSIFLVLFISIAITIKCIQSKNINFLRNYYIMIGLALLLVWLFCPLYFVNFKTMEHMQETKAASTLLNFLNFKKYGISLIDTFDLFIFNNIGFYIILYMCAAFCPILLKKDALKGFNWQNFKIIFAIVLFWSYLITVIAPFDDPASIRYTIAGFSIVSILLTFMTYCFRKPIIAFLVVITLICSFVSIKYNISMKNSKYKNLGLVSYYKEFKLFDLSKHIYDKAGNRIPIVFIRKNWVFANYIFYLPNDEIVRLERKAPPKDYVFDSYLLIDVANLRGIYVK